LAAGPIEALLLQVIVGARLVDVPIIVIAITVAAGKASAGSPAWLASSSASCPAPAPAVSAEHRRRATALKQVLQAGGVGHKGLATLDAQDLVDQGSKSRN
jgi:hypothetical protein